MLNEEKSIQSSAEEKNKNKNYFPLSAIKMFTSILLDFARFHTE